jgi:hypothetical protein
MQNFQWEFSYENYPSRDNIHESAMNLFASYTEVLGSCSCILLRRLKTQGLIMGSGLRIP